MQKVVGSSPIIRSQNPRKAGVFLLLKSLAIQTFSPLSAQRVEKLPAQGEETRLFGRRGSRVESARVSSSARLVSGRGGHTVVSSGQRPRRLPHRSSTRR